MKTILLLRHAKSSGDAGVASDRERPLADRGIKAARRVGRFLGHLQQGPARVLSSPAVRALDTARLAADAGGWGYPVQTVPEFYSASSTDVFERLRLEADDVDTLLLVGHEPTWSEVTVELIGGGAVRFPTAALAQIALPVDRWREVGRGRGELIWFVTPRLLRHLSL